MSAPNWYRLALDCGVQLTTTTTRLSKGILNTYTLEHEGRKVRVVASGPELQDQANALNEAAKRILCHIYNLDCK